jgi:hypothetical protein
MALYREQWQGFVNTSSGSKQSKEYLNHLTNINFSRHNFNQDPTHGTHMKRQIALLTQYPYYVGD